MNLVDSSGWVEYLQNSPRADLFAAAIEDHRRLLVPTIALYEVHKILSRALPQALVTQCLDVLRRGRVLELTDARAIAASEAATRFKLAMADAAMYCMAQEFDATFWTQDVDYQGLTGVRYFVKVTAP
jgi:toxin FitB